MTNNEMLMLEKGRVPTIVVQEALSAYLSISDRSLHEDLLVLSEKAQVPYETLETWIMNPDHGQSVEFDAADRVLCATRLHEWWRVRFFDYYINVDLAWRTCACPGCSVKFRPDPKAKGKKPIYCSKLCCDAASNMRVHGAHTRRFDGTDGEPKRMKDYGAAGKPRRSKRCRNGHKRTPDNTIYLRSGMIRCRMCNNAASKRGYHNRKKRAGLVTA